MDFRERRAAASRKPVPSSRTVNTGRRFSSSGQAPVTRSRAAATAVSTPNASIKVVASPSFKTIATAGGAKFKRKMTKVLVGVKEVMKPVARVDERLKTTTPTRPQVMQKPRQLARRPSLLVVRRCWSNPRASPRSILRRSDRSRLQAEADSPIILNQRQTRYRPMRRYSIALRSRTHLSASGIIGEEKANSNENENSSFCSEKNAKQLLLEAIGRDDAEIVKELAMKDRDFITGIEGERALVSCARVNAKKVIGALLNVRINPNTPLAQARWEEDGYTPLHAAVHHGELGIIYLLLKSGAYVDPTTTSGRLTPLHVAALHDRADCCVALIGAGADFTARDLTGRTPLDLAEEYQCRAVCHLFKNFYSTGIGFGI